MKKIEVSQFGGPENLILVNSEIPNPGANQVLIKVAVAGVNFIDVYQCQGLPSYNMKVPFTPGLEGAGVVKAIGTGVSEFKVGDQVAWTSALGSYSQYHLVEESKLVRVPAGIDLKIAGSIMLQGLTAHYLSHSTFPINKGDVALVHAAAGGTGRLLCQMILNRGGKVIATTSSASKAASISEIGVTEIIRYDQLNISTEVKRITNGTGVNVVYDGVGKSTFDESLASLKKRGMLVLFGASSGAVPPFEIQRLNSGGSLYLTRPSLFHYTETPAELRERSQSLFEMVAAKKLEIKWHKEYKLDEAGLAHSDITGGKTSGKLVLFPE
jgi:NADPH2:quinone reductase